MTLIGQRGRIGSNAFWGARRGGHGIDMAGGQVARGVAGGKGASPTVALNATFPRKKKSFV